MPTRGDRVKKAIRARHSGKMLTLANDLGVDESAISRWKKDGPISLDHAARLCFVLDISLDWLILGRGNPELHKQSPYTASQLSLASAAEFLPEEALSNLVNFLSALRTL